MKPPKPIAADRSHGGNAPGMLDFSASLNPLGPPARALNAYHDAARQISSYPEPYAQSLVAAIAARIGVAPQQVLAGNGSTQLIHLLARVLRPNAPLIVIPTFSEIANALLNHGCTPQGFQLDAARGFAFHAKAILATLQRDAQALFFGRPNSPTGSLCTLADVETLALHCQRINCWCIVDEAFIEFTAQASAVTLVDRYPRLIVLRSLTKLFAIPGLRLGYLVGAADLISRLGQALEPWSVNSVAQRVAHACLEEYESFAARSRQLIDCEREFLMRALGSQSWIRVVPSAANFLMIQVSGEPTPGAFGEHMKARAVAVRGLRALPGCGPGDYRVAVRLRQDNEKLLEGALAFGGQR